MRFELGSRVNFSHIQVSSRKYNIHEGEKNLSTNGSINSTQDMIDNSPNQTVDSTVSEKGLEGEF